MRHFHIPQASQTQILLVDDEPEELGQVSAVLSRAGFACQCCTTVEEALAQARRQPPDLIISDINLGGENGLAMCEQIREEVALYDVPVMFLSGA